MSSGIRARDDAVIVNDSDLQEIGATVRTKLEAYVEGAPVPRWDLMKGDQFPNLHASAGVRSSSEFMRGAKSIGALWENGRIILTPEKNEGGARGGFSPLEEREHVVLDTVSDVDLGAAVIAALAVAE